MEREEPAMEAVPLDLTLKKDNYAVSESERDCPGKLTEGAPLPQSSTQNSVESTPLDLSVRRALPLQPPPSPTSANVSERATVVVPSSKVELSTPPSPQCKDHWTLASPSPMMATEHLAPLHGMYPDAATYQHKVLSSAAVPEYNMFPPVHPTSVADQFHQKNHIQHQLQHLYVQQQQLLQLQNQLQLQHQLQSQLHQLNKQQRLQLQAVNSCVPLDSASILSNGPVYTATSSPSLSLSNHFPSPTGDDHHQQQQQKWDLDPEHHHHINEGVTDDVDVVDPEEVAAIYRQSDFLSLHQQYLDSLGLPRNIEKIRRSSSNNNNSSSSRSSSNNNNNHSLTAGQQQNDQTYAMKRKRKNEVSRRSWDAKRQKYFENQISVMYLTKKVSEMKDIKRRLLKANGNILAE